ncbi:MAG: hypothetical protein R3251_02860 [Candidatus Spechtbacterales bacterium]|nr:hypothetical protein [Candidatus Spechtbacterales bacterium]
MFTHSSLWASGFLAVGMVALYHAIIQARKALKMERDHQNEASTILKKFFYRLAEIPMRSALRRFLLAMVCFVLMFLYGWVF